MPCRTALTITPIITAPKLRRSSVLFVIARIPTYVLSKGTSSCRVADILDSKYWPQPYLEKEIDPFPYNPHANPGNGERMNT